MLNVKRIFFISEQEARELNDRFVDYRMPHYELEDGRIVYTKAAVGGEMSLDHWVEEPRDPISYQEEGYGSQRPVVGNHEPIPGEKETEGGAQ